MEIEPIYFNRLGYVQSKVSNSILEELKQEAKFVLENENKFQKYNNKLAGNIEKEYSTDKTKEILEKNLITLANGYHKHLKENTQYLNWEVKDIWINFQKKYEHNPLHNHSGDLSFVLWIQIPYNLKEELEFPNSKNSNTPANSLFEFVYTDFFGRIVTSRINVDKSYEGTIVMFPSSLNHTVHPFYTSDEYRISISGNLIIAPPKNIFSYKLYK